MNTQQLKATLVDQFFAMLNQQAQSEPRQIAAPQAEPPRPYYAGPPQSVIDRQQIEDQLRALVEASTARLYEMLKQQIDEIKSQQQAAIDAERRAYQQRLDAALEAERQTREKNRNMRVRSIGAAICTPSRNNLY